MRVHSSLAAQLGFDRVEQNNRLRSFRIEESDKKALRELKPLLDKNMERIVDAFYAHIEQFPEAMAIVRQAGSSIPALKKTNPRYFAELVRGEFDEAYFESRLVVGRIHAVIGLRPEWFYAGMSTYYHVIVPTICRAYALRPGKLGAVLAAFNKAFNLDQALIMEAYIEFGLVDQLRSVVHAANDASEELLIHSEALRNTGRESATAVNNLAAFSDDLSRAMEQQALQAHEAIERLGKTGSSGQNTTEELILSVQKGIEDINSQAGLWSEVKARMEAMDKVGKTLQEAGAHVSEMNDRAQEIGNIVVAIESIADQTNLLALNAAIEAARAGDAGRGFAVVAEEVRKLAETSAASTREIAELISSVREGSRTASRSMEHSMGDMKKAADATHQAVQVLESIASHAAETASLNEGLTDAVKAFSNMTTENMGLLGAITEQNNQTSEEMTAFTESMLANVEHLITGVEEMDKQLGRLASAVEEAKEALGKASRIKEPVSAPARKAA